MKIRFGAMLGAALLVAGACAAQTAEPSTFSSQANVLRSKYGAQTPPSDHQVFVTSTSVHHTASRFSTYAWRGPDGTWTASLVGETGGGGLLNLPIEGVPERIRTLTPEQGRELDGLLADPQTFQPDPPRAPDAPPWPAPYPGQPFHFLEMATPAGRITSALGPDTRESHLRIGEIVTTWD